MQAVLTSPNVLAVSYPLETGATVTFYKATPGNTTPRMAMAFAGGSPIDCGAVDDPDRFGPHETPDEFAAWAENFRVAA